MATVYEAIHTRLDTKVAIKILDTVLARKGNIKQRFENEAKIMASLKHQNITQVIDFDDKDDILAIIMELFEGESLSEYIKRNKTINKKDAIDIFYQMLDAFAFAHQNNIVHRDVKPSNIFINSNGKVKILDFGIAKILEGNANLTSTGTQMGTPTYMSPEQVKDAKDIDLRSDIYSLGVVLFYMLNGKPPYDTTTTSKFDIFTKIVNDQLPSLEKYPKIDKIIKKATAKNRDERYKTCEEFMFELNNIDEISEAKINNKQEDKSKEAKLEPENKIESEKTLLVEQPEEKNISPDKQDDITNEKNKKPKKKKAIIPIIIISILTIITIGYFLATKETNLYKKATKKNTVETYQKYIEKYPDGKYMSEVMNMLSELSNKLILGEWTINKFEVENIDEFATNIVEYQDSLYEIQITELYDKKERKLISKGTYKSRLEKINIQKNDLSVENFKNEYQKELQEMEGVDFVFSENGKVSQTGEITHNWSISPDTKILFIGTIEGKIVELTKEKLIIAFDEGEGKLTAKIRMTFTKK